MTGNDKLRKKNQALRNEIEELKNKLQKVTDDCQRINMADRPNRNCHQEKRIQSNLCQATMRGRVRGSSQELTKFQFYAIILANLASEAYNYQFIIKVVGVPTVAERETSQQTADLCTTLFVAFGVEEV